jgi:hypothetical protein
MIVLRWILGCALLLFCAYGSVGNTRFLWVRYIEKRRPPSWVPLVAGLSGAIGLWVLPLAAAHKWWWVPLILDWGSLPGISHAVLYHLVLRPRNR